ncbi:P-loop NTPase fold protein [uncultured Rheinheimera sp.]|uniref:KAP family P-loop NTPase fold protein n=1 Tax=uncultured Rheinheimera sp. TaxID=400532 RepID=UPI0025960AB7|nr:P-loop NTPase fold protein [uncultured Rheinheimera sp.]
MDDFSMEDVYRRKGFAESLITLIKKVKSPFCFGVDARWGNGKTTFVKEFLAPAAKAIDLPIVIFDCFEHERMGDPFFSITQHILEKVTPAKDAEANERNEKIRASVANVALGTGKVIVKAISKTLLKQELSEVISEFTTTDQSDIVADDVTTKLEEFLAVKLQNGLEYRKAKESFHQCVEKLASELSANKKIVVVIDELDRCKPSFALEVLESMKHLLNAKGLVFVLTYHRDLLCGLIRHEFGADIDANMYLHKFVNHDLVLPTQKIKDSTTSFTALCSQFMNSYDLDSITRDYFIEALQSLHKYYEFEARTIDRMVVLLALSESASLWYMHRAVLIVWTVKYPHLLKKFSHGKLLSSADRLELMYDDVSQLISLEDSPYTRSTLKNLDCMFNDFSVDDANQVELLRLNINKLLSIGV